MSGSFDEELMTVFETRRLRECRERALVLEALGIGYQIVESQGRCILRVAQQDAERAERELRDYQEENRHWSINPESYPRRSDGLAGIFAYAGVLLLVGTLETLTAFGRDWRLAGKIDAGLIRDGEWWRAVTALTLHLDLPHLAANLVFGGVFGLFVGRLLGSGFGWFSILLAGALGNLLNVALQPAYHTAVGASTAIFAALGLLAAYAWKRRTQLEYRWAYRWAPLIAGVAVLAYTGIGGERTDVMAHVTGFVSGVLFGWAYGAMGDRLVVTDRGQVISATAALAIIVVAWWFALTGVSS